MSKVWFIKGVSLGIGLEIARAALTARDSVVATGRDARRINDALDSSHRKSDHGIVAISWQRF